MSTPIATVLSVSGQAWARDAEGNLRPLEPGDVLLEGEELVTGENGRVRLDFAEAEPVTIGPEQTVAMLADLDAQADMPTDEAAVLDGDLEALLTAIDEGEGDLLDVLDATAAGLGGGAGGEDGGHSFVQLARISLSNDSPSYAYEPVVLDETETALFVGEESLVAAEAVSTEQEPVVGSVTLSTTPNVVEGNAITVTASVDVAPTGSPLILTLSNGQQIVIAVGETSGSVTFDSRVDDAYAQGDQPLNLSITDTQGGGYEALDTTSTATVTTVDDSDATTITLDAPTQVTEGGQITVTASVDQAVTGSDLVIDLGNGNSITIPVGASSGSVEVDTRTDDAYVQGDGSVSFAIVGTRGGNYEALDITSTASTTVADDSDATTITLSAPEQITEGGQITVTASVNNAPQGSPLVIELSNGQQITIAVGETTGSVSFDSRSDDAYQQGTDTLDLSITGTTGGNYESLNASATTSVAVVDDSDATTITLSAPEQITEGGQITVTASVDQAVTGSDLVIDLGNGNSITIPVGASSGSVDIDTRTDDAYVQGDGSVTFEIVGTRGGNYEALDTTSTASTTVADDSDATTITLSAPEQVSEGEPITVSASVDQAVTGSDLFIDLGNGNSITIPVGASSGSVDIDTRTDDAYVQGDGSVSFAIVGTRGGNYEALDITSTASTTVADDSDATTITLSAPEQITEGGQITVTASVNNAPQGSPLVIELSNGQQIIIAVGKTSGSVSFDSRADDVYVYAQGTGTLELSIDSATGGDFEAIDSSATATVGVVDDNDTVTATLSSKVTSVAEGGSVTYTVTLSGPEGADLTKHNGLEFRLVDGSTVSLAAGATSGNSAPVKVADDALVGGQPAVVNSIKTVTGDSGFEKLVTAGETTVTVTDEPGTPGNPGDPGNQGDAVTISIVPKQASYAENEAPVFVVSIDKPQSEAVTVKLDNGQTATIAANASSAEYMVEAQGDDVFVDTGSCTVALQSASVGGKSFENLQLGVPATVTITDTIDTVTATLTSVMVGDENGATVIYTMTLGAAPKVAETFTFEVEGVQQTIMVEADKTTGSTQVKFSDPDIYVDSDTIGAPTNLTASNYSGYEAPLNVVNAATAHNVADSIDTVTATLTSSIEGDEDSATVTYTMTLSVAPEIDETFTFEVNGQPQTITIQAEQFTGSTEFIFSDPDVYIDNDTIGAPKNLTSSNNGGYENLTLVNNAAAHFVNDSIDITTVNVTAIVTKTSEINVGNVDSTDSFTVRAYKTNGDSGTLSRVTGTDHDGFGVAGKTSGSGDSNELGFGTNDNSEKVVVDFNNAVKNFEVRFAWRNNSEKAKVEFFDEHGNAVGWAIVSEGGSSTQAVVNYYDGAGDKPTKTVFTAGGSDQVDNWYSFEPGSGEAFTRAVFSAVGNDDDYLIHSIKYKEVMGEGGGSIEGASEVIFEIETSNPPDASQYTFENDSFPIAKVEIGDQVYEVKLDRNGKGTVTIEADGSSDLTARVLEVGGNFEAVDVALLEAGITVDQDVLEGLSVLTDDTELRSEPFVITTTDFSQALSIGYGNGGSGALSYKLGLEGSGETGLTITETGEAITLFLRADGKLVGQGSSGSTVFDVAVDDGGKVTLTQHMAVSHTDTSQDDEVASLDGLGIKLVVTATDADENTSPEDTARVEIGLGKHLQLEDDGVSLSQNVLEHHVTAQDIPNVLNGRFDLSSSSAGGKERIEYNGFTVTALGFTSASDSELIDASVYRNNNGMGVMSDASPYHNLAGEVDYRVFADAASASEALIFKLDPGSLAFGLSAEFKLMFGGEREEGLAVFFRDGTKIGSQAFTSDTANGNYAADFDVVPGGFDEVRFMATSNGGANPNDNSDFAIKSITFTGDVTDYLIAAAEGQVSAQAADGVRFKLTGLVNNFGYAIALSDDDHTLVARDSDGANVFEVRLSGSAGTWDFLQYQVMESAVEFIVKATDGDGDSVAVPVVVHPEISTAPDAVDDALTTTEDTSLTIQPKTLLENDRDVDGGNSLAIASVSGGTNGTAVLNANGTITFTPDIDFNGEASFNYTVSGSKGSTTATATVVIDVTPDDESEKSGVVTIPHGISHVGYLLQDGEGGEIVVKVGYSGDILDAADPRKFFEALNDWAVDNGYPEYTAADYIIKASTSFYSKEGVELTSLPTWAKNATTGKDSAFGGKGVVEELEYNDLKPSNAEDSSKEADEVKDALSTPEVHLTEDDGWSNVESALSLEEDADPLVLDFGDQGTVGAPAIDIVADFDADEGDKLDLSDLLTYENQEAIDGYIMAEESAGKTTLHISTQGSLGGDKTNSDQTVVLDGVTMGGQVSHDFIQAMINSSQLDIDK